MAKLITSRFPGRCRKCSKPFPKGEKVYYSKGFGTVHVHCETGAKPSEEARDRREAKTHSDRTIGKVFTQRFDKLKAEYSALVTRGDTDPMELTENKHLASNYREKWNTKDHFYGAKTSEMLDWLKRGFPVETFSDITALIPERPRRKLNLWEEGDEIDIALALAGEELCFTEWDKREAKPGINLMLRVAFSASTNVSVITKYAKWIARAIYTLECCGYDCRITYRISTENPGTRSGWITSDIVLKQENEAADFASFSPIFSPGGFRHLGFYSIIRATDHFGYGANFDLGIPFRSNEWGVNFNSEERTIELKQPNSPLDFPEWKMTEEFSAVLNQVSGQ